MPPEKQPQYATRSLLSRSWVDWAIEAARRVGAEPVDALGGEAGLRLASAAVQAKGVQIIRIIDRNLTPSGSDGPCTREGTLHFSGDFFVVTSVQSPAACQPGSYVI